MINNRHGKKNLTLKNGSILVPVEKVERLLELLNLLIRELVEARASHSSNSTTNIFSQEQLVSY